MGGGPLALFCGGVELGDDISVPRQMAICIELSNKMKKRTSKLAGVKVQKP